MKPRLWICAAVCLLFALSGSGRAYFFLGPRWPSGSIAMHLQLGTSGTLADGTTWDTSAEGALSEWNPYLTGVQFGVIRNSSAPIALGNDINNVFWDSNVYGDPFPREAVAVAPWYARGANFTESDVIFNTRYSWNSYRGPLVLGTNNETLYDIHRVALHEFGHTLGLDHPDEHSQSVPAIMTSVIGNLDRLQSDDINGARALYSTVIPTNRAPVITATTCNPCQLIAGQAATVSVTASDPDGDAITFSWTTVRGTFSNASASTTRWTSTAQAGQVTITITVRDARGASAAGAVTVNVLPGDSLSTGGTLTSNQYLLSANSRYRLLYQSDGNLVLYDDVNRAAVWATNTGRTNPGQLALQNDGNLVLYTPQGVALWATRTSTTTGAQLVLQNDGNLVLYGAGGRVLWTRFS